MCGIPSAVRVRNHSTITGPKKRPTRWVPKRCTAKRAVMIPTPIGRMLCSSPGADTLRPSTAESTEIAGVIRLSPKKSEAPITPRIMTRPKRLLDGGTT